MCFKQGKRWLFLNMIESMSEVICRQSCNIIEAATGGPTPQVM